MATQPILDFAAVDLTEPVAGKEELLDVLPQRGTFVMVDGVLHLDIPGNLVVGYKDVRSDEWWAPDHIPGRALFPGTLMIEGAAQLCTYDFVQRMPAMKGQFVGFSGVEKTRFRMAVEPDCRLVIAGRVVRIRSRMFHYAAQGFVDQKLAFETEIMGMAL